MGDERAVETPSRTFAASLPEVFRTIAVRAIRASGADALIAALLIAVSWRRLRAIDFIKSLEAGHGQSRH